MTVIEARSLLVVAEIMKLSQVISILLKAHREFGDVDCVICDPEDGRKRPIKQILKLHPYTDPYGCLNRAEPVNAVEFSMISSNAEDLVLNC